MGKRSTTILLIYFRQVPMLTSAPTCTFIHPAVQTSVGHAAQALNQHKKACAAAVEERVIYLWPSYKKNVYLPWSFCITLAMSKCFREAMLFCCSANNKVGYWCVEDPSQLSSRRHPLCPSSSALSFYFHCRNKLNWISGCMQGQAAFTVQWECFIQPLPAQHKWEFLS